MVSILLLMKMIERLTKYLNLLTGYLDQNLNSQQLTLAIKKLHTSSYHSWEMNSEIIWRVFWFIIFQNKKLNIKMYKLFMKSLLKMKNLSKIKSNKIKLKIYKFKIQNLLLKNLRMSLKILRNWVMIINQSLRHLANLAKNLRELKKMMMMFILPILAKDIPNFLRI